MKCPFVIKKCTKCGRLLVAYSGNFHKQKGCKYGVRSDCKMCCSKYKKQHYEENADYIKEKSRQYHKDNKDVIAERSKQYRDQHKEEKREYDKKYRAEHREEKIKRDKQYYENNKEKILEYQKQYTKNNPHIQFNHNNKRRQLEESQGRGINKEQWLEIMNFFGWKCAYSDESLTPDNRTIDHIIALNNGGLNEPWNCIPCLDSYNSSKCTQDMVAWYKQQEFFDIDRLMKIYEWQEYAFEKWGM